MTEGNQSKVSLLNNLIINELLSIPIEKWGFFYPCHVAIWRFIESQRHGVLGDLNTGYDEEPYFKGKGSKWFCDKLCNLEGYLDIIEEIMYSVVGNLNPQAKDRGCLLEEDSKRIKIKNLTTLSNIVLSTVDDAIRRGEL